MKSSNLKRLCDIVLVFILVFSMSSCKREDIVSNTVFDSTESTYLYETESATENTDKSFSTDSEQVSELHSVKKNSDKQKHVKNNDGAVKKTNNNDNNNNVGNYAEPIESNTVNTYTLSVTCINAVSYASSHNITLPDAIPSDGVILKSVTAEFNDGDSVMKVLKSTLKANGISCQITSGGYVRSIGGLAEFDCGQQSGWMYKVNGILPNVSCKSYKLTSGDKIEFIYTCNLGNDV